MKSNNWDASFDRSRYEKIKKNDLIGFLETEHNTKNKLRNNIDDLRGEITYLKSNIDGLETLHKVLKTRLGYWKGDAMQSRESHINMCVNRDLGLGD